MQRRKLIASLVGIAFWPFAARAQQPRIPVIGYLSNLSANTQANWIGAFRDGLNEFGIVEGQNVTIEYRYADGQIDQLKAMAADLIARQVDLIVATGGNNSPLVAKSLTSTIPIIFTSGLDPVKAGLVTSLNKPDANVTGISWFSVELGTKHVSLSRELFPTESAVAVILNRNNSEADIYLPIARDAAHSLGLELRVLDASTVDQIAMAFEELKSLKVSALIVGSDPFYSSRSSQLAELALRYSVPLICGNRDITAAGGLLSYGNRPADSYRSAGNYAARVLKGAKVAELPIYRATKFDLVINLKTAKLLGLTIPPMLLARADEVIE